MSLREARTKKNLSQMQLADLVDKGQCDISAYELQRRNIDQARPVTICKLAYVLGCKVWEIVNDKELSELLEKVSKYDSQCTKEFWRMRKKRKLHQYDLAAAVGVHRSTISEWESKGMRNSRIKYIALLCDVMKCHPTDIIEDPELQRLMSEVF